MDVMLEVLLLPVAAQRTPSGEAARWHRGRPVTHDGEKRSLLLQYVRSRYSGTREGNASHKKSLLFGKEGGRGFSKR